MPSAGLGGGHATCLLTNFRQRKKIFFLFAGRLLGNCGAGRARELAVLSRGWRLERMELALVRTFSSRDGQPQRRPLRGAC